MRRWLEKLRQEKLNRNGDKTEERKREVVKELLVYSFSVASVSHDRRIMNRKGCESKRSYRI
jgi:hypothetical protein